MRAALLFALTWVLCRGQMMIEPGRAAELVSQLDPKANASLQCQFTVIAPALSFSLRYQTGYLARVPLGQFHGSGHWLSVITRVTARGGGRKPVYLQRTFDLPDVPQTDLTADLAGAFLAGEGHYQTNAILFDDQHRACRSDWQFEVRPRLDERDRILLEPAQIAPLSSIAGKEPSEGVQKAGRLTLFVHAASFHSDRSKLEASDVVTTISSIAAILERLPSQQVRLVVFNLHQPKELYRNEDFALNDLGALTRVLDGLQLDMVDYTVLQHPDSEKELLRNLIHREINEPAKSQAVIFLGPDGTYGRGDPTPPADVPGAGQRFYYLQFQPQGVLFNSNRAASRIIEAEPVPPIPCQNTSPGACGSNTPAPAPARWEGHNRWTPGDPDAIAITIRKLKGKVVVVRTAGEFAKALDRIGKP